MSRRRATPEHIAEAKAMKDRGYTFRRIAELLGFTDAAVHRWIKGRANYSEPPKPKQRAKAPEAKPKPATNPAVAAEIILLHRKGLGRTEIAALTGARYAEIEKALS